MHTYIQRYSHQQRWKFYHGYWKWISSFSFVCFGSITALEVPKLKTKNIEQKTRVRKKKIDGKSAFDPTSWILFTVTIIIFFMCIYSLVQQTNQRAGKKLPRKKKILGKKMKSKKNGRNGWWNGTKGGWWKIDSSLLSIGDMFAWIVTPWTIQVYKIGYVFGLVSAYDCVTNSQLHFGQLELSLINNGDVNCIATKVLDSF